ncbi:NADH-quinone oxidoreductase subunit M [Candidatus Chloroploca sp. M-50]|uniref:NADH-quinone oxidoreductase subunit M n=1 Tax=Candidatus Chloroploca mongolica TaxID=2528176 RepID=A0ABS4DCV6_9CHLR|nr:NADH-quinone oxidoreductase subunit M [Candidatus Chloroploca mongolica]MBP1467273.1 NADH-quinone oxidoreductase subunit M [Candidatus Chloroploca mongolica]
MQVPILSLVLWLPALGALLLLTVPRRSDELARRIALAVAVVTFLVSLTLPLRFVPESALGAGPVTMQFAETVPWLPSWGISYSVAIDGVSLWLVMLTTFLTPIVVLSTWDSVHKEVRNFQILLLLLTTAMLGVFMAQDLLLFYIFWEFTLIPMTFLIGIWGGSNRVYAARKFFLYTFAGSVLMLLAVIGLYVLHRESIAVSQPGYQGTLNFGAIVTDLRSGAFVLETATERLLFGAFFLAFAIKVPLWPFHTWLPDAHVEAPTAGSVVLAGVLLKLGGYGMIRYCLTLFPEASRWAAPAIGVLAVIGIIYGAIVAFAQTDMKKLVAYSSVSHMGFIVLGIFALNSEGITGAIIQMISHGLSTGALFLIVGVLYERRHTREMAAYSGIWTVMPIYAGITLLVALSSAGLPGLNGFIGEFVIMQGAFLSPELGWPFMAFAVLGVVLAAIYLLKFYREVFMGEVNEASTGLPDLNQRELVTLVALCIPIVIIGLYPGFLFGPMQSSVAEVVNGLVPVVAGR